MCGIVGRFILMRHHPATPPRWSSRGPPPRTRREGRRDRRPGRLGPCSAEHHRPGRRPAADGQPRRLAAAVTFNGEIFNYVELRDELMRSGHRFATQSDTEVILHAYEEYGDDCVEHFNGQWAFAIWDQRRRAAVSLPRPAGHPPAVLHASPAASSCSPRRSSRCWSHPDVPRRIDPRGLDQVFTFWSTLAPRTVFEGIRELPPGHNLRVEAGADPRAGRTGSWTTRRSRARARARTNAAEQLLELLTDATRLRLRCRRAGGRLPQRRAGLVGHHGPGQAVHRRPAADVLVTFDDAEFDESGYQRRGGRLPGHRPPGDPLPPDDIAARLPRGDLAHRAAGAADGPGAAVPAVRVWSATRASRWC